MINMLTCDNLAGELSELLKKCDGSPFVPAVDKIIDCTDSDTVTALFTPNSLTPTQISDLCAIIKKCLEEPALKVIKTATSIPSPIAVGQKIIYQILVQNTGNVTMSNVVVTDNNATVIGSPIASIPVGGSTALTAEHTVTSADLTAGKVDNQATATGTSPSGTVVAQASQATANGQPGPTSTPIVPAAPAMTVVKTATVIPDPAAVGQKITYQITVNNTGNVPLTNVPVTDANATVIGSPIANIPVGGSATVTAEHTLTTADIAARKVDNRATASGTSIAGPISAQSNLVTTPICAIVTRTAGAWSAAGANQWSETTGVVASWTATAPASVSAVAASTIDAANLPAWYNGVAPGAPALAATWTWDSAPETPLTDIDLAGDDKGSGTFRLVFPAGTTRKVLHIDRLGGSGTVNTTSRTNSLRYTLTTPGTLTKLSGTDDFAVTATTIQKVPDVLVSGTPNPATGMGDLNTAGGSVLINTASNTVDFNWTGVGVEGGGADGFRITVSYDIRVCGP